MKSSTKPTPEQVAAIKAIVVSPEQEVYFFHRLDNPHWIEPLHKAGFFKTAPALLQDSDGGTRWANWPASQYLARMAAQAPEEVCAIFIRIESDNPSVQHDLLNAAMAMPVAIATKLVPKLIPALSRSHWAIDVKDGSQLCARFAVEGQLEAALMLAEVLFRLHPYGENRDAAQSEFWYIEGLKIVWPAFLSIKSIGFVKLSLRWLERAAEEKEPDARKDRSEFWRPAIEKHEQNRHTSFPSQLVDIIRDMLERAIQDDVVTMSDALSLLGGFRRDIFRRIQLHLLAEFGDRAWDKVSNFIMRKRLFDNSRLVHEYSRLVQRSFSKLDPDIQAMWLNWIDEGPDSANYEPSERAVREKYWRFKRLHWIRGDLMGRWKDQYDEAQAQFGEPELSDLNIRTSSSWGSKSPYSVEQLNDMGDFPTILAKIVAWAPETEKFHEPDREGLLSTFAKYVSSNPIGISGYAKSLIGKPADYVRTFINGMDVALREGKQIDINCVVDLCKWVVDRPLNERTTPPDQSGVLVDPNWQWTRDTICSFIERSCEVYRATPSMNFDAEMKGVITYLLGKLTKDTAKSNLIVEKEIDPRIDDFVTFAINSPRGKALEAMFSFAHLLADRPKSVGDGRRESSNVIQANPKIEEMLGWQISNGSFAGHAIIGRHFALLYWIDQEWLRSHVSEIFELSGVQEKPAAAFGWGAWNAYLVWGQPHIEYYHLLRHQYLMAVEHSMNVTLAPRREEQPMLRLGEHLVILFGRGQLQLDDDGGLLRKFLTQSAHEIRSHAISFAGQSVCGTTEIPAEITDRFITLWEWYWPNIGKDGTDAKIDAGLFGWWFTSGKFSPAWSIQQLFDVVQVVGVPHPDHEVMTRLAEIAMADIETSVSILEVVERADAKGEGWHVQFWLENARSILGLALAEGGAARETAERVMDHLGRRGFIGLRDLLTKA